VAFSPDGTKIVSGSNDTTIQVWDSGAPEPSKSPPWPKLTPAGLSADALGLLSKNTNAHSGWIRSVAFSPDGTKVVSGSDDKTIKVWKWRDQPGERTIVASRFQALKIPFADPFAEAKENAWTPISINGITVTSWGEIFHELVKVDGEVTIKVWADSGAPEPSHRPSLANTDACAGLSGRHARAVERKDQRPQQPHHVSGVFPGRDQDRVRIG